MTSCENQEYKKQQQQQKNKKKIALILKNQTNLEGKKKKKQMINMIKSNRKCRLTTSVFFWGNSSTLGGTPEVSERRDQALAFKLTVTLVV